MQSAQSDWLWKGRRVYLFDGSTVSMPDTPENQAAYPQHDSQKPGLGFPLARIAAIFSLSCGAIIDLGICRYAGKGQGEISVFRTLWDFFCPGDVVLTDRLMCTWRELLTLQQRGVDSVSQLQAMRKADFRRGQRLGKGDHIVRWKRPWIRSLSKQARKALPEYLTVRECRIHIVASWLSQQGDHCRNNATRCPRSLPKRTLGHSIGHVGMSSLICAR